MNITINGNRQEVAEACTLADLLRELEVNPLRVAVEVNAMLIPRSAHGTHQLHPNDCLEVVTLVGGG